MKHKLLSVLIWMISCFLFSSFPAFADQWKQDDGNHWKYIQEDGSLAVGRTAINSQCYYFDENGNRQEECWKKSNGSWYYYGKDGTMATDTWIDNYYVDRKGRMTKTR